MDVLLKFECREWAFNSIDVSSLGVDLPRGGLVRGSEGKMATHVRLQAERYTFVGERDQFRGLLRGVEGEGGEVFDQPGDGGRHLI